MLFQIRTSTKSYTFKMDSSVGKGKQVMGSDSQDPSKVQPTIGTESGCPDFEKGKATIGTSGTNPIAQKRKRPVKKRKPSTNKVANINTKKKSKAWLHFTGCLMKKSKSLLQLVYTVVQGIFVTLKSMVRLICLHI